MVLNPMEDPAAASGWVSFRAFGHTIRCNRPAPGWLPAAAGAPDLTISFTSAPPFDWQPAQYPPVFLSQTKNPRGQSTLSLYRLETCWVMQFLERADCYIWPERVICCLQPDLPDHVLNVLLLTNLLPFWLELKGFVTLHASAVNLSGHAVAFIGHSHHGKSTLAASMLQQGYSLLTDDVLPVIAQDAAYLAYPGFPSMRMWPGETEHFLDRVDDLERVHPQFTKRQVPLEQTKIGAFSDQPAWLKRVYILDRRDPSELPAGPQIQSVSHRNAVIELLRYSFVTRLAEAAGLLPQRFQLLTGLVQQVPLSRLIYPSGYPYLPQIRQAILVDLSVSSG